MIFAILAPEGAAVTAERASPACLKTPDKRGGSTVTAVDPFDILRQFFGTLPRGEATSAKSSGVRNSCGKPCTDRPAIYLQVPDISLS